MLHRQHAAEAVLDQAKAQYRSTVLAAMQNVADVLQAVAADAEALRSAMRTDDAAGRTLRIARDQSRLGQISGVATMTVQTAWLQAEQNVALARAQRLTDTVTLYQAFGGGRWRNEDTATNHHSE